jgi:predicted MFS family arabinose efflux permease
LGYIIALGLFAKFFVDITVQLYNPFLTIYAGGLGVSAVVMGRLVSVRNFMGLTAPLFGALADRAGYRLVMRLGLAMAGAGMLLLATGGTMAVLVLAMMLAGMGQAAYTPSLHAYVSARSSYERRAQALGIVEYAWALAGIVGLFLVGQLIEVSSWREPLLVLGGMLLAVGVLLGALPPQPGTRAGNSALSRSAGWRGDRSVIQTMREALPALRDGLRGLFDFGAHWRSAVGSVLVMVFNFFAVFHVLIIHGGWLEQEYGLGAGQLGSVALLLGVFDWIASISVSAFGDRLGKKRSVAIGVGGMVLFFALLPMLNRSLPLALASIVLPRFFFEFATVSNFPLLSEQLPERRGKMMSLSISGGVLGTAIAASTGPTAYLNFGVWGLGPVSAASAAVSFLILLFVVREAPHRESP